jgi:hypothetical protein
MASYIRSNTVYLLQRTGSNSNIHAVRETYPVILAILSRFSDALHVEAVTVFNAAKPQKTKFYLRHRPRNFNIEEVPILIIRYLSIGEQILLYFRFLKTLLFTFLCNIRLTIVSTFVPQPRYLVAIFPSRSSEFDPRSSYAWFVV